MFLVNSGFLQEAFDEAQKAGHSPPSGFAEWLTRNCLHSTMLVGKLFEKVKSFQIIFDGALLSFPTHKDAISEILWQMGSAAVAHGTLQQESLNGLPHTQVVARGLDVLDQLRFFPAGGAQAASGATTMASMKNTKLAKASIKKWVARLNRKPATQVCSMRRSKGKARRSKPVSYSGWSGDELLRVFAAEDLIRI